MKPVFLDFHIHTSNNPESLNNAYDIDTLKSKIEELASGSEYLISISDHNAVNKVAYLEAVKKIKNLLLGVELHIKNHQESPPYHCHIIFNLSEISAAYIDDINKKLDKLYPKKIVKEADTNIPKLEDIMNTFDGYDFLLLPHGGQNHSTFNNSIPKGASFDRTLERSIYYNYFDGFTARNNTKLEIMHSHLEKLGIKDFVNLVTATDNYVPSNYPECRAGKEAGEFIPTWMLASPTFDGLRLSLSESSRLKYGKKPDVWSEFIRNVSLKNDAIDIDAALTPGLNVVIGGSSSGKSLFVDSIHKKTVGQISDSVYEKPYGVSKIQIDNPTGQLPHYIDQNYIARICDPDDDENRIEDISILKSLFPSDSDEKLRIANGLSELTSELSKLIDAVKQIENLQNKLARVPQLSHLIVRDVIQRNPIKYIVPSDNVIEAIEYGEGQYDKDIKVLNQIDQFLKKNPLIEHDEQLIIKLKQELATARKYSMFEGDVREIILTTQEEIDELQEAENQELTSKRTDFEKLLKYVKKFITCEKIFYSSLEAISKFQISIQSKQIESMGHKLYIDNEFELSKTKFLEIVNGLLKTQSMITSFDAITPESLFAANFRKKGPKVANYEDFEFKIKAGFENLNQKKYRITTKEGKDFDKLSPGWKTSIILDLILDWADDNAPLIIDQPEDNLATGYINDGLLKAIKKCKAKKQIILVSHNATIPMLGDAQNIIMCKNEDNHITIRSNPLEGSINGTTVVDLIASTADGGKSSIKKRFKKYNIKSYREISDAAVV